MIKNWDSKGIKPFSKYLMDKMVIWNKYQCSQLNKMQSQQPGQDVKGSLVWVCKLQLFREVQSKKKKNKPKIDREPAL